MSGRSALGWARCRDDEGWTRHSTGLVRRPSWPARRGSFDSPRWGSPAPVAGRSRRCQREDSVAQSGGDRSTDGAPDPGASEGGFRVERRTCPKRRRSRSRLSPASNARSAGLEHRTGHLATQDGDFMTQHDDFDREFVARHRDEAEQLERSGRTPGREGQRHAPASSLALSRRNSSRAHPDDILGTQRVTACGTFRRPGQPESPVLPSKPVALANTNSAKPALSGSFVTSPNYSPNSLPVQSLSLVFS